MDDHIPAGEVMWSPTGGAFPPHVHVEDNWPPSSGENTSVEEVVAAVSGPFPGSVYEEYKTDPLGSITWDYDPFPAGSGYDDGGGAGRGDWNGSYSGFESSGYYVPCPLFSAMPPVSGSSSDPPSMGPFSLGPSYFFQ
ncbi:hypothetical protein Dimus_013008 [Dionaea muscipula]